MAIRYRDLERPQLVDTTQLETGNSEAAAALARSFKAFEGIAADLGGNMRAQQGQQAGAEQGAAGTPEFRAGLRAQTRYGQAYNNAAMRSYAIKTEADADDVGARLEVESQNDPEKFGHLFDTARDAALKEAPVEARGTLATIYGQRRGAGIARLRTAQATEARGRARADTQEGLERSIDKAAQLHGSDDPANYEAAVEEETKVGLMIDGAVNDGTFTASEGAALHKDSQRMLVAQTISQRFRRVLDSAGGNPVDFIEKLRKENLTSEALSPKEEDALVTQLIGDLTEHNRLMAAGLRDNSAEMKARYEQGDRDATAELFAGTLTTSKLRQMVLDQRLDPGRATSLQNDMASGDKVDDSKEAFRVHTDLMNYSEDEIKANNKLSYATRDKFVQERRDLAAGWRSTQAAQEGKARIERALGIIPGTNRAMLSDAENEALDQALTTWYNDIDALPANERQTNVIKIAEQRAGEFIRKNKSSQAQDTKRNKAAFIQRAGDPTKMSEEKLKQYNKSIANYDRLISEFEAEAARK
ncbi:MAG: hypothetical protein ACREXP_00110 [Steroidobacteraceae bacterium]